MSQMSLSPPVDRVKVSLPFAPGKVATAVAGTAADIAVHATARVRSRVRRTDRRYFFFFLTFQLSVAGEPSTLPAASFARTSNVCLPFLTLTSCGEVQGWKGPLSSLHSNVEPASDELNSNVAVFFLVFSLGPFVMVVFGGVVSPAWGSGSGCGGTGQFTLNSSAPMSGWAVPSQFPSRVRGSASRSNVPSIEAPGAPASIVGELAA